jgi:hypothetical protein
MYSSLSAFFGLVLSAAGFFLVAEFFLDSVTATVFLFRMHNGRDRDSSSHGHGVLLAGSVISALIFLAIMVGFFIFGPSAIGGSIDYVMGILIVLGIAFAVFAKRHNTIFIFHGHDLADELPDSNWAADIAE